MIEIVPFKSSWPVEFIEIGTSLRRGLGKLALRIDHIGSTSIPGSVAKDIIDVQVTVPALSQEAYLAMLYLGYTCVEPIRSDHRPAQAGGEETEWEDNDDLFF
jgi:GrpB-like predicted nucleotidyltransferase (UPF0157 family)